MEDDCTAHFDLNMTDSVFLFRFDALDEAMHVCINGHTPESVKGEDRLIKLEFFVKVIQDIISYIIIMKT